MMEYAVVGVICFICLLAGALVGVVMLGLCVASGNNERDEARLENEKRVELFLLWLQKQDPEIINSFKEYLNKELEDDLK